MIGPIVVPVVNHWHRARAEEQHDGDTIMVLVEEDFNVRFETPLRVYGVNAAEIRTIAGKLALEWGVKWFQTHIAHATDPKWPFMVQFVEWDKYAPRFDGILLCGQSHCYNDAILADGFAIEMKGVHTMATDWLRKKKELKWVKL